MKTFSTQMQRRLIEKTYYNIVLSDLPPIKKEKPHNTPFSLQKESLHLSLIGIPLRNIL